MAVLSDNDRIALHQRIMQRISSLGQATGATKAASYNTAIPAGIRGKFTVSQKALALALVCFRRAGEG